MSFVEFLAKEAADITARCTNCGRCVEACPMPGPAWDTDQLRAAEMAGVNDLGRHLPFLPS